MDNGKKAMRAGKRILSDLAMIKAPQDSDITITNKTGTLLWINTLEFYCNKSDFVEPACKKFSEWKNNGKLVT